MTDSTVDNVVVVVIDALRADRVGATGCERNLTPNIDALAAEGTAFRRAFSTTNTTDPAMTSLHSGRYTKGHGIINHGDRVKDREKRTVESVPLLPEVLSEHGVRTVKTGRALGRWHKRGFDVYPDVGGFEGEDETKNPLVAFWDDHLETRIGRLLYRMSDTVGNLVAETYRELRGSDAPSAVSDFFVAVDEAQPMDSVYGLLHLMDTHASYQPREELIREYLDHYDDSENIPLSELADMYGIETVSGERCEYWTRRYSDWKDEQHGLGTAHVAARYDAAVTEADEKVGRLVEGLRQRGVWEETMVIVLADHGESLTEHGILHDHHGLYDVTVRIPLVVRVPDAASGVRDDFVGITDVAPTVLDYLNVDHASGMATDGRSLRPLLAGTDGWEPRTAVVAEEAHTQRRRMVRTDDRKYIRLLDDDPVCRYCGIEHAGSEELYDLNADPEETENLAADRPDEADALRSMMAKCWETLLEPSAVGEESVSYDDEEEIIDRLEALGYR